MQTKVANKHFLIGVDVLEAGKMVNGLCLYSALSSSEDSKAPHSGIHTLMVAPGSLTGYRMNSYLLNYHRPKNGQWKVFSESDKARQLCVCSISVFHIAVTKYWLNPIFGSVCIIEKKKKNSVPQLYTCNMAPGCTIGGNVILGRI